MIVNGTLNSLTKGSGEITLNITPSSDVAYDHTQVFLRKYGLSQWTQGVTYVGVSGVAGDVAQTGLENGVFYEFMIATANASGEYSLPSSTKCTYLEGISSNLVSFIDNTKLLLANSAEFQAWVGAADSTEALDSIHIYDFDYQDQDASYPFALINFGGSFSSERINTDEFKAKSSMSIFFFDDATKSIDRDHSAEYLAFCDAVGKIEKELELIHGVIGLAEVNNIGFSQAPAFTRRDMGNPEIIAEILIDIGV